MVDHPQPVVVHYAAGSPHEGVRLFISDDGQVVASCSVDGAAWTLPDATPHRPSSGTPAPVPTPPPGRGAFGPGDRTLTPVLPAPEPEPEQGGGGRTSLVDQLRRDGLLGG